MSSQKEIADIFRALVEIFPEVLKDARLASGGLPDAVNEGSSDVDVFLPIEDPNSLRHVFGDYLTAIDVATEKKPHRVIYHIKWINGRDVSIYAVNVTADPGALRVLKHRQNELLLNKYKYIRIIALNYKKFHNLSTEEAWAKTLQIEGDPYEILARDDLEMVAMLLDSRIEEAANRIFYH